jgi:hypothetical protein
VGDLAAEADGVAADRRAEAAAGLRDVAGEAEVAHAVGRLGELAQEAARRLEGGVHVPERAGAAEAGELQAGGGMALGDGAGLVDADEEERHALGAVALQGREALGDLLDRGIEGEGQGLEIVAQRPARGRGSGRRAGGPRRRNSWRGRSCRWRGPLRVGAEAGEVERGLEQVVVLDQRDLVQGLERLGGAAGGGGEGQAPGGGVVAAERARRGRGRR